MIKIDPAQRSRPEINPEKVCFVIAKSRQWQSDDFCDGEAASTHSELTQFIDALDLDEQCALVALTWIGRGDFEPEAWREAETLAAGRRDDATSRYLIGVPLLPDYLEEALAAFGCSCRDFDSID